MKQLSADTLYCDSCPMSVQARGIAAMLAELERRRFVGSVTIDFDAGRIRWDRVRKVEVLNVSRGTESS